MELLTRRRRRAERRRDEGRVPGRGKPARLEPGGLHMAAWSLPAPRPWYGRRPQQFLALAVGTARVPAQRTRWQRLLLVRPLIFVHETDAVASC